MGNLTRRGFIRSGLAAGAAVTLPVRALKAAGANDSIYVGMISCGSRAGNHMDAFSKIDGVRITGLCDPDQGRLAAAKNRFPSAQTYTDMRKLLEDKNLDVVVVATCNHWHCLATIWAMQAGLDVYVEKPLSHSQWEGKQTVAAAKKYNKICQIGTQQRSFPMQKEIQDFLHKEKALGKILSARVNRYGVRGPIGKRDTPLPIPKDVDYNIWLGPAQDLPIFRDKLQYDWHWVWNTGSGEMGNWGVHVLDDLRYNIFQDKVALPKRILGGGGRVVWNDAGETPNVHFAYFDTGEIPVVIGLSNIKGGKHPGPGSGYIAYCEGGRFEGSRGGATAYDNDGKVIKKFRGGGGNHQKNFIDAVRARDNSILNAHVSEGNNTTGWCNLANIAFRAGSPSSFARVRQVADGPECWHELLQQKQELLASNDININSAQISVSPMLELDPKTETFVGANAELGNKFLKREYRKPFVVPEIVS